MIFKRTFSFILISAILLLMTASCSTVGAYKIPGPRVGHGPPAHAPAHGYRRKQVAGFELVFDSSLGLYVVVGNPDLYYCDGYFYRLRGTVWEISQHPDNGWNHISGKSIPRGLQAKNRGKHNKAF